MSEPRVTPEMVEAAIECRRNDELVRSGEGLTGPEEQDLERRCIEAALSVDGWDAQQAFRVIAGGSVLATASGPNVTLEMVRESAVKIAIDSGLSCGSLSIERCEVAYGPWNPIEKGDGDE